VALAFQAEGISVAPALDTGEPVGAS
jgi:hypothetical protein